MVRNVLADVDVLQLPALQLDDGPWTEQLRLDAVRFRIGLLLGEATGRRAGRGPHLCLGWKCNSTHEVISQHRYVLLCCAAATMCSVCS